MSRDRCQRCRETSQHRPIGWFAPPRELYSSSDFAPDGESLLYFSSQLGGDVLLRVPLDGAAEPVELARGSTGMLGPLKSKK